MDMPETPAPARQYEATYLALGDSYTIGESVHASERWSVQLAALLTQNGKATAGPDIIAKTGWTTAELAEAIRSAPNTRRYTLVSLLIGVNNQYRGQSVAVYRNEFRELLQTAVSFAGGDVRHVFVLSIPDWGVTPFAEGRDRAAIAAAIDTFNQVALQECEKAGAAFIDITDLSRTAAADTSLVAGDRLHFSGKMYALWAARALPVVAKMI